MLKKVFKIISYLLATALVVVQFIRPAKNSSGDTTKAVSNAFSVPQKVETILKTSCYDCHSNTTVYPWYAEVQPLGWWLADHINEGKKELNFDEFASYRLRKQYHKFEEIGEQISEEAMPLPSYLIAHRDAILSSEQRNTLISWSKAMIDSMKAKYPLDSLVRRQGNNPPQSNPAR